MLADLPFDSIRFTSPPRFIFWNRDFHWAPPALPDFDLWCILEGRGVVDLRGQTYTLVPGLCFLLRPGDRPQARHDPAYPLVAFYAHFDPLDGRNRKVPANRIKLPPPAIPIRDLQLFQSLARRCVSAAERNDSLGRRQARLAMEQMLTQVWEWSQSPAPLVADELIFKITRQIQRNPSRPWNVAAMASESNLSRAQFTRRFNALMAKPPMAFVIQTRLQLARQLILETEMSLTQIAADLGYSDLYFFSRQFKLHFAQSPGKLRKVRRARP